MTHLKNKRHIGLSNYLIAPSQLRVVKALFFAQRNQHGFQNVLGRQQIVPNHRKSLEWPATETNKVNLCVNRSTTNRRHLIIFTQVIKDSSSTYITFFVKLKDSQIQKREIENERVSHLYHFSFYSTLCWKQQLSTDEPLFPTTRWRLFFFF